MDVFLIPVGGSRYELYCEVADTVEDASDTPGDRSSLPEEGRRSTWTGWLASVWRALRRRLFRSAVRRFRELLAVAERERRRDGGAPPGGGPERRGLAVRVRARVMRWLAETVAEQRLLWQLRRQREATIVYPSDVSADQARAIVNASLVRDGDRHRFWMLIDLAGVAVTGPLFFFVPGPNLISWYLTFRSVGHFLSWRGARQGLGGLTWHVRESGPLAELRQVVALGPEQRRVRLRDVAERLRLQHLASFVERLAVSSS
jgi:hypothetical protein